MDDIQKIKNIVEEHEKRISKIELMLKSKEVHKETKTLDTIPTDVLKSIVSKLDELTLLPLVLLVLRFNGDITKGEQIKILKKWGKKEAESLRGGNYNRDMLSTGWVHEVGKSGKESVYGLTEKGKIEANKIITELQGKERNN